VVHVHYNIGKSAKLTAAEQFEVVTDKPVVELDGYKLNVTDNSEYNINHRAIVYYLGDNTEVDIYDEAALKALDPDATLFWDLDRINKLTLTKSGRYAVYVHYNIGKSAKQTVVTELNVELLTPTIDVVNGMLVVGNIDKDVVPHRTAYVYYLGDQSVEDIYDEEALKAIDPNPARYESKKQMDAAQLTETGNYVIVLHYNYAGSPRMTLAKFVTL